ncbi:unnamed protein product [Prunus armeniaca]|uniref:ARID domain-containing protein n=1 Tax=Prunus armeniaca TaxID=36596 RepID=A0A6J5WK59_PRUAR|nr:unnamed protein product [Prunus armeniaca]
MAGWSMVADGSALDCAKTPKKNETDGFSVDLEPQSEAPERCVLDVPHKLRCWFDQLLGVFLKEISAQGLLSAFASNDRVWDSVAKECGLGWGLGWAVKLVYVKYLHLLERVIENKALEWSVDISGLDLTEQFMDLEDKLTKVFPEISDQKVKDGGYPHVELSPKNFKDSNEVGSEVAESDRLKKSVVSEAFLDLDSRRDAGKFCNGDVPLSGGAMKCTVNLMNKNLDLTNSMEDVGKVCDNGEVSEVGEYGRGKKYNDCDEAVIFLDPSPGEVSSFRKRKRGPSCGSEVGESRRGKKYNDISNEDAVILDPSTDEEANSFWKRKQKSLCGMLNWVRMIAKDPCDPAVGSLPERSKWKSFGNEENWMQVLWAREAIFVKKHADSGAEQSNWQKNQRMHPSLYDDHFSSSYNLRERLRLEKKLLSGGTMPQSRTGSESSSPSYSPDMAGMEDQLLGTSDFTGVLDRYPPSHIPLGFWPLEKPEHRYLIERDPIGKGRQESCGCQVSGSIECVRFHISEKRLRVKLELGPAFYHWEFNQMGEEVGLSWTVEEEKKFRDIVKSNPPSLGITFWDQIFKSFLRRAGENW